jgi:arsenate reductase
MSKNKIYHLSSCNTCQRIIKELGKENFELIDIKSSHINESALDELKEEHGSYEALFNKRAMKYRAQELNKKTLSEADWKTYILGEYTFLKRPVIIINGKSFVGNSKKTVAAAKEALDTV